MEHLAKKYATLDLVADAENKLRRLKQADEFRVFTDFLTEFVNLADICDWDSITRVRNFREKIASELTTMVSNQVNLPARDDWDKWVEIVSTLAANKEAEINMKKANGRYNNGGGGNGGGNAKNDPKNDPMDIDTMKINMAKILQAEKERRYNEGLCYNCGQAGHVSRSCTNPTNTRGKGNRARGNRGGQQQQRGGQGGYGGGYNNYNGNQGQYQGGNQGGYQAGNGHQQRGGYPQQTPQVWASQQNWSGGINQAGAPGRRGGMKGNSGYRGNQQLRFIEPGHVVGEVVDADDDYGTYEEYAAGQDEGQSSQQGNA
ncbi:hypothetical protein C8A00DRAFT_38881 [Chaetomidium leptoderma]|uniref:CCHC-type domain-containing protein n=1 Tax=Chaetomidium leptoderma TaxID=669021 RepID=A0AAN6VBY0_9PEZI|nr:hypothetical protein C8A00DRAFT_38881 [Chaetomidium leptoderma]